MIKNIYILDVYEEQVTGFTTYKNELFYCLKQIEKIKLHHVIFDSPENTFCIKENDEVCQYFFPIIEKANGEEYYDIVCHFFRLYIVDSVNTVFLLNAAPYYSLIKKIRAFYSNSKIIIVIHDFIWASILLGDVFNFTNIIQNVKKEEKYRLVYFSYEDGLKSFNISDRIICMSMDTYNLLSQFYGVDQKKISLVSNGIRDAYIDFSKSEKNDLRRKLHINSESTILLFVGRVSKQKGAFDLFKSFEKILSFYPDCILAVAGSFFIEDLKYINNSIKSKILCLGSLDEKDLRDWYRITDIGIVSSFYEQCSYSGIEMMMHAIPIVASDGFGVKNMFNDGNAYIAKIENRNREIDYQTNIFQALMYMLKCSSYRKQMGMNSRESYQKMYTISQMKSKYSLLLCGI